MSIAAASVRLCCLLALTPIVPAIGQSITSLRTGETIRITTTWNGILPMEGKFLSATRDSFAMNYSGNQLRFGLTDVTSVERKGGRKVMQSLGIGVLVGTVAGLGAGFFSGDTHTGDGTLGAGAKGIMGAITGSVVGLVGGGIFGACCASPWHRLSLRR